MYNGTYEWRFYYDANDEPIGFIRGGSTYNYVKNLQGDIVKILDNYCNEIVTYTYDSWGNLIAQGGSTVYTTLGRQNPLRYRGYFYDTDTGLYYLQSRYYNAEWGRFVNADDTDVLTAKQTNIPQNNLFAFCENNPVHRIDDNGEFWHIIAGAVIGGLVSGIVTAVTSWAETSKVDWEGVAVSAAAGAVSGALAATGVGLVGQVVANAAISGAENVISQARSGNEFNEGEFAMSVAIGGLSGLAGGKGASSGCSQKYLKSANSQLTAGLKSASRITSSSIRTSVKSAVVNTYKRKVGDIYVETCKSIYRSATTSIPLHTFKDSIFGRPRKYAYETYMAVSLLTYR